MKQTKTPITITRAFEEGKAYGKLQAEKDKIGYPKRHFELGIEKARKETLNEVLKIIDEKIERLKHIIASSDDICLLKELKAKMEKLK